MHSDAKETTSRQSSGTHAVDLGQQLEHPRERFYLSFPLKISRDRGSSGDLEHWFPQDE
jgi:hypothetical protein